MLLDALSVCSTCHLSMPGDQVTITYTSSPKYVCPDLEGGDSGCQHPALCGALVGAALRSLFSAYRSFGSSCRNGCSSQGTGFDGLSSGWAPTVSGLSLLPNVHVAHPLPQKISPGQPVVVLAVQETWSRCMHLAAHNSKGTYVAPAARLKVVGEHVGCVYLGTTW